MSKFKQEEIVNFLKNYGFVFAGSEIYNGLANS
jgi:glycyl-tRNA synthetase